MKNSRIKNGIMRIVQGIIIGAGAILPGISGGVLAVVFGIYRPAMELLTHPRRAGGCCSPSASAGRSAFWAAAA
jgi:putative membrane protein